MKSFDRLEYALDDIRNDCAPVQRTLRVQMPPSFAVQLAVPILRDFREASTEVDIDLISPYGLGPPLGDVDVAVVYSKPTVTDLVTDLLWPVRPSLLRRPNIAAKARWQGSRRFWRRRIDIVHVRLADLPRHAFRAAVCACQTGISHGRTLERGLVFDTAGAGGCAMRQLAQGIALCDPRSVDRRGGARQGRLVQDRPMPWPAMTL